MLSISLTQKVSLFQAVLPVKHACGNYLFDLLGKHQLTNLLDIAEQYTIKQLRVRCAKVLADDFDELLDGGVLWKIAPDVWKGGGRRRRRTLRW